MDGKQFGFVLTLVLAFAGGNAMASSSDDDFDGGQNHNGLRKMIKVFNKAIKKAKTPEEAADLLVGLKVDSRYCSEHTKDLSHWALRFYKMEEANLSKDLDPFTTSLEYFDQMSSDAFKDHYLQFIDSYVGEHEKLLRLRKISQIYKKMAELHSLDGNVTRSDHYYMLSARQLVDGLYDYSDSTYVGATLRMAANLLKKTTKYDRANKPLMAWVMDSFKKGGLDDANKLCDLVLVSEVENATASDLYKASYYSFIGGDANIAEMYFSYGKTKMSGSDPLLDSNVYNAAERFTNVLAIDVLNTLFTESRLMPNHRVLVPKWENLYEVYMFGVMRVNKPFETIFGAISLEDLRNPESLYNKVRLLHQANVKAMPK